MAWTSCGYFSARATATNVPQECPSTIARGTPICFSAAAMRSACASGLQTLLRGRSLCPNPGRSRVTTLSFLCKPPVQKGRRDGGHDNTGRDRKGRPRHSGRRAGAKSRIGKIHGRCLGRCTTARASEGCCTAGQLPVQPFVPSAGSIRTAIEQKYFLVAVAHYTSKTRVRTTI
jgi:hypothetical protein